MHVSGIQTQLAILCATVCPVSVCSPVAHPSIATCCPPHSGDGMVKLAAAHRCCAAACSFNGLAGNAGDDRV
jgi:hypothetical protein